MNNNFFIQEIKDPKTKSLFTKNVLEKLPEWFGNQTALNEYVQKVANLPYWAALCSDKCLGFFSIQTHYSHTGEIVVCGVLTEYHHIGIGKSLYHTAEIYFRESGCKYVVVKTLSDIVPFEPYSRTRQFYKSVGFEPLITLTEMWDDDNPCLIMFKSLL